MDKPTENLPRPSWEGRKWLWVIPVLVVLILALLLLNHYYQWYPWTGRQPPPPEKQKIQEQAVKPKPAPIIDYDKIEKKADKDLKALVEERKKMFGLDKSVDMVVKSGEMIRVGKKVIPLNQILTEIEAQKKGETPTKQSLLRRPKIAEQDINQRPESVKPLLRHPEIVEEDIEQGPKSLVSSLKKTLKRPFKSKEPAPTRLSEAREGLPDQKVTPGQKVTLDQQVTPGQKAAPTKRSESYYGIYIVRPGDNLWNIHFAFLREYFGARGIRVSLIADEPFGTKSSGVGRILKYAESMVYIFNFKTGKLSENLNLLDPYQKIAIFNLTLLDRILGALTAEKIHVIRFDGRDLILPD
ncbi:MAG: hypothetical protein JRI95_10805 [Deltaproteobacteria bacterium]|nr:hypothetical protein [Deltaproteobacteria bacterium]